MSALPTDAKITYELQYRKCGKPATCRTCREGKGHGPYWYAYWRTPGDPRKLHCKYVGKKKPAGADDVDSTGQTDVDLIGQQ